MEEIQNHYLFFAIIAGEIVGAGLLIWGLFKSRLRYKAICENSGSLVIVGRAIIDKTKEVCDVEIVNCNQVFADHLNKSIAQVRGMRLGRDFYAGVKPEWFSEIKESVSTHQSKHIEFEYAPMGTRYTGTIFCLSVIRGRHCVILNEVSEEYNRQQALELSRQFTDSVLSLSGVGFWRWNFKTKEFLIIKSVFPTSAEMHLVAVPNDEILAEVHPDDALLFVRFMACAHPTDSMMESAIFRLKNLQGDWHWVQSVSVKVECDSTGKLECMDGVLLDIDSLKRVQLKNEEAAREFVLKQQQLLYTMRQCQTGFCHWHVPSDRVYFDDNFWESVGCLPPGSEAMIPKTMTLLQMQVLPDGDPSAVADLILQIRDGNTTVNDFSFRCQMAFQPDEWLEVRNFVAEWDQDGRPLVVNAVVINISELKKHELALESAMLNADLASKAKSRFLGIMSHEIRTPLNSIIGFSSMIKKTESPSQMHSYADSIQTSGEALLVLINDLMDVVKRESSTLSLHLAPLNLYDMLSELREMFALKTTAKGLYLNFECPQKSMLFNLDSKRLNQVLVNLIGNAVKFTDTGGITVQVIITPTRTTRSNGNLVNLCDLHIAVKDTGVGIPEEYFGSIFEPFEQVAKGSKSKKREGSGLGLAICDNLVDLMDGKITVTSKVGEGSIFTVTLGEVEMAQTATSGEAGTRPLFQSEPHPHTLGFPAINGEEKEIVVELVAHFSNTLKTMNVGMHVQSACLLVEQLKSWVEQRKAPRLGSMVNLLAEAVADFDVTEVQRICDFLLKQGGDNGA